MSEKVWKVLIADDEAVVLEMEAKRLRAEGFEVVEAADGVEAARQIISEQPDIVVMDLTMPGKTGFEVIRELRAATPAGKWVPVIIVSARGEMDDMRQGFDLQADHYIHKPCRAEDIVQAVRLMIALIPLRN
ncbi:MAG: response regulator [Candidatus Omnitrophica bacterium]|nr:response regulator [Candidatus Omnitrophota bacterium]